MNVTIDHPTDKTNFSCVTVGDLSIWFSYRTPIAFQYGYNRIVVRENDWSTTTGKHLAFINPDKGARVSGVEFERLLAEVAPKMATA